MGTFSLGTWGFFKESTSGKDMEEILAYALSHGVRHFDTALVYGNNEAERILGQMVDENCHITTKIPSIQKPKMGMKIRVCYTKDWMDACVEKSLRNLNTIDTLLLHNWSKDFELDEKMHEILGWLRGYQKEGICKRIGISLPNGFLHMPAVPVRQMVDVFMLPYNEENEWSKNVVDKIKGDNCKIKVRSIFSGNSPNLTNTKEMKEYIQMRTIGDELVIGTRNTKHVQQLLDWIEK